MHPNSPPARTLPAWVAVIGVTACLVTACSSSAQPVADATGDAPPATPVANIGGNPASTAGSTSGGLGAGDATTDCGYISPTQLSAIEGATYGKPSVAYGICSWAGSDGNAIMIQVTKNATATDWKSTLATIQGDQSAGAPASIAGLADKAAGVGLEIAAQHGSTIIDVRDADSPGFGKWPKSAAIVNTIIAGLN